MNGTDEIKRSSVVMVHMARSTKQQKGGRTMNAKMTMIYWKGEKFWLGKLLEHPEIMTQAKTLEELEENIKDAYLLMAMDDVPEEHKMKEIAI
ncbi:MAG: hypothetical protein DDT40_01599 [candidate division WS2 bacterium]|uniref:HicB family protein n=2 Tax=Bacteria TaxID=2 RepID=A0A9E2BLR4_PSYF1|nr:hypothetical protein [Candidatus Psychracetigena formicireducens]MBT9151406.1 hypothetical protein [Candidatus Psychracetigena formicireducens]